MVRAVDTAVSRQGQATKTTARRSLPIILPKSLPPKPNIPRRLASILPAPAKTTTSSVTKKVILPAAVSSSSPIPIAPLPRPSQSLHGLPGTGKTSPGKTPAMSVTTGQNVKRYCVYDLFISI